MPYPRSAVLASALAAAAVGCNSHRAASPPSDPSGGSLRAALVTRAGIEQVAAATPDAVPVEAPAPQVGRSPIEKFVAGDRSFGVYTIHDADHCDLASWNATAAALGLEAVVLDRDVGVGSVRVTVGAMTDGVVGDLLPILTALRDAGGTDLDGHHVCIVPAAGAGVALSVSNGFIAFEPAAIIQLNTLVPDAERSMYSVVVVYAHELAHQFQYWYGNPFADDKSARRTELAADCMGTAFVAMGQPDGWIMDQVATGAAGALQAYADVKFRSLSHHGTRVDRGRMAAAGIDLVKRRRAAGEPLDLANLKTACETAVTDWDASLPLTPPDQLWGGQEP